MSAEVFDLPLPTPAPPAPTEEEAPKEAAELGVPEADLRRIREQETRVLRRMSAHSGLRESFVRNEAAALGAIAEERKKLMDLLNIVGEQVGASTEGWTFDFGRGVFTKEPTL